MDASRRNLQLHAILFGVLPFSILLFSILPLIITYRIELYLENLFLLFVSFALFKLILLYKCFKDFHLFILKAIWILSSSSYYSLNLNQAISYSQAIITQNFKQTTHFQIDYAFFYNFLNSRQEVRKKSAKGQQEISRNSSRSQQETSKRPARDQQETKKEIAAFQNFRFHFFNQSSLIFN